MRLSANLSKKSLGEAYETGKRGANWADRRIRKLEKAFNIAGPLVGALQPELLPAIAATKAALINYDALRKFAIAGDQIKQALE